MFLLESIFSFLIASTKKNKYFISNFGLFLLLFATFFKNECHKIINLLTQLLKNLLSLSHYQMIVNLFSSTDTTFLLLEFSVILFGLYLISDICIQIADEVKLTSIKGTFMFPPAILYTLLLIQQKLLNTQPGFKQLFMNSSQQHPCFTILFVVCFISFLPFYIFILGKPIISVYIIIADSDMDILKQLFLMCLYSVLVLVLAGLLLLS